MVWLPLIIPAFKMLKQKDQKTAANLGYISRLCIKTRPIRVYDSGFPTLMLMVISI